MHMEISIVNWSDLAAYYTLFERTPNLAFGVQKAYYEALIRQPKPQLAHSSLRHTLPKLRRDACSKAGRYSLWLSTNSARHLLADKQHTPILFRQIVSRTFTGKYHTLSK